MHALQNNSSVQEKLNSAAQKWRMNLREKGVSDELIEHAVSEVIANELENATEVWHKKFKQPAANRDEWAKQARFLQSRGFGFDTIKKVLSKKENDD